jgi:hypothetical protein
MAFPGNDPALAFDMARQIWNILEWREAGDRVAVLQAAIPDEPITGAPVAVEYILVIGDVHQNLNPEDVQILIAAKAAE